MPTTTRPACTPRNDPRVVFTGYVFGEGYWELASNAYAFVLTSGVGGTHPALVEAMAFGNCVVVYDTPENLETIRRGRAELRRQRRGRRRCVRCCERLLDHPDQVVGIPGQTPRPAPPSIYTWDAVTDAYEALFYDVLAGKRVASFETAVATARAD